MERSRIIELIIEEINLKNNDLSLFQLQISVDSQLKEFSYPYKDIYFSLPSKSIYPTLKILLKNNITVAEGSFVIKNLKLMQKLCIDLILNKKSQGFASIRLNFLQNYSKKNCKHCGLIDELLIHTTKTATNLSKLKNYPLDHPIGLEINIDQLENLSKVSNFDLKYIKNML